MLLTPEPEIIRESQKRRGAPVEAVDEVIGSLLSAQTDSKHCIRTGCRQDGILMRLIRI